MTKHVGRNLKTVAVVTALAALSIFGNVSAAAQQTAAGPTRSMSRTRAEQEAEQRVALSPDKIVDLLTQEPGLLLEVKKMLVRKAYEQGRILDPEDLTDEALFELLRQDNTICVLATREIEDREYVKAKPTREQIERQREIDLRLGLTRSTNNPAQASGQKPATQEGVYWDKHDATEAYPLPSEKPQPLQSEPEAPTPRRNAPPIEDTERQLQMTGIPQNQDIFDGMGVESSTARDSSSMRGVSPEQLPALLNASSPNGGSM